MKFLWAKRKNDEQHNYDCAFALNLMFEFQTLFTPKNCATSKLLATSPYTGSSVLYGDGHLGIYYDVETLRYGTVRLS